MPYKPARPCPGYGPRRGGCTNLIRGSQRYCHECEPFLKKKKAEQDKNRGSASARGYDHRWHKLRELKMNRDPLCEVCLTLGKTVPADVVHHIKPVDKYPELRLDYDNLMSLCTAHHEEIHRNERWRNEPAEE